MEDALGVWDGNAIELGCDDHCTTTNVTNSLSNIKKIKRIKKKEFSYLGVTPNQSKNWQFG